MGYFRNVCRFADTSLGHPPKTGHFHTTRSGVYILICRILFCNTPRDSGFLTVPGVLVLHEPCLSYSFRRIRVDAVKPGTSPLLCSRVFFVTGYLSCSHQRSFVFLPDLTAVMFRGSGMALSPYGHFHTTRSGIYILICRMLFCNTPRTEKS